MKKVLGQLVVWAVLAAPGVPALKAAIIQIDFSGTVDVSDPNNHFNGLFRNNEGYTARIIYDSASAPVSSFSNGTFARAGYAGPLSFEVNVGGYEFSALADPPADGNQPQIVVQDQSAGFGNDAFLVAGVPGVPDFMTFAGAVANQMDFDLGSLAGTLLSNTGLPTSLSLDQADRGSFGFIDFGTADSSDRADLSSNPLQSLTFTTLDSGAPEPSTWLLLGSGAGMFWVRRRRRQ